MCIRDRTRLAVALRPAVIPPDTVDRPAVAGPLLATIEAAWQAVSAHAMAEEDPRVHAFAAAVRLTRWLAVDSSAQRLDLGALHRRHLDTDAWVDAAVNDAATGVGDAELGAALSAVLTEVRRRRDRHDTEFAQALAAHTRDDSPADPAAVHLEDLLATMVFPLVARVPVLVLVLDGMSAAVGSEIVASVVGKVADGWSETLPAGHARRIGAVSVLPSITAVSRTSLLCGELRAGGQDVEQRGYAELVRAHGLAGARLFHKKPLDSSQPGFAVAHDVGAAIDDQVGQRLVTCVLNTIDDALDRSDPAGTVWTAEALKHLAPLLDRARLASRARSSSGARCLIAAAGQTVPAGSERSRASSMVLSTQVTSRWPPWSSMAAPTSWATAKPGWELSSGFLWNSRAPARPWARTSSAYPRCSTS